jgi:hypothetical protein
MRRFKAIETDRLTRQRSGREYVFDADNRDAAIAALLTTLGVAPEAAHADPGRTLVEISSSRWTIVAVASTPEDQVTPSLRRAGAKHKHVRD